MPVIAIVGAGPGMGLAIARPFGSRGFDVALIARTKESSTRWSAARPGEGVTAAAFPADVMDRPSLAAALEQTASASAGRRPGVLPRHPRGRAGRSLEVTADNLQPEIEYFLYGAVTAATQVLPAMREAGAGTLLFTTGGGSMDPVPHARQRQRRRGSLRNWVINLHKELAGTGVQAAHVAIGVWIGAGPPEAIAATYWNLYRGRDRAEVNYVA